MGIEKFDQMVAAAVEAGPVPVAVAAANDPAVLKAVDRAQREGIVRATLVGDWPAIEAYAAQTGTDLMGMTVIHEADTRLAARQVVLMARDGETGAVVKGQIKTADLLVQVLNREVGIRGHGLLTHVGIFELPGMDRLIYLSDSGVVVYPDVYQKLEIIKNAVAVARLFGLAEPKVCLLYTSDAADDLLCVDLGGRRIIKKKNKKKKTKQLTIKQHLD